MKTSKVLAVILAVCLLLTSMPLSGLLNVFAQSSQPDKITICGSENDKSTWIYKDVESGMYIREFEYDMDENANASVDIIQLTDLHINKVNEQDTNSALVYSKGYRSNFYPEGSSIMAVQNAMDYAASFDQTVITGDVIDYLSAGALEMTKKYIWDEDPNVLAAPGNHEFPQVVGSGAQEVLSFAQRKEILQNGWIHDIDYYSRLVKDKVLCVVMNNASIPDGESSYRYLEGQAEKLAADIALAKEKGYIILIFQHLAISTGNAADTGVAPLADGALGDTADIKLALNLYDYNARAVGGPSDTNQHTRAVYDLITKNADVIKGIFAGHVHNHYTSYVKASYQDGGNTVPATIPQYILSGNFYSNSGNAIAIKINYRDDNLVEPDAVESITLDKTQLSVKVGDNYRLKATVAPATADDTLTWTSSDKTIATVNSNGRVVGMSKGTATITATDKKGKKIATCEVAVTNPEKPNILKIQGTNAKHHIGKTFTNLTAGTYKFSVYCNNASGGASVPFVIEDPYSTSGNTQFPSIATLVAATAAIGTISNEASTTHNKIEITFTVKSDKSYFCGVTGSSDTLPVYYTGFSLTKQGSDTNLFLSEFLGNGLADFELYAGNEAYYYGCRPQGSKFALLTANGTGKFAYPEDYTTFDNFFASEYSQTATGFAGGTGTENDPYLISNAAELKYLANMVNNAESGAPVGTEARWVYAGKYFKLTDDIYLNSEDEYSKWSKTTAPSKDAILWEPIGHSSSSARDFAGVFDGDGHTVYGLYCKTTHENGTGLFGSLRNGVIKNLNVKNAYLTATGKYVGGIVGIALANSETLIDNCGFSGDIVSTASVRAGGIAGRAYPHGNKLTISNCWSEGTLTATGTSGGIVGEVLGVANKELAINNCYTAIDFDSTANSVAGLIGYVGNSNAFKVNITNCHVAGTSKNVYPLLGETLRTKSAPVTLNNVYYKAGSYTGTAKNVATQGKITATNVAEKTAVAFSDGTVTDLLNANIDQETAIFEWVQGDAYPQIREKVVVPDGWDGSAATGFAGGNGTEANPYQISNAAELKYFANMVNNTNSGAPVGTEARWVYAGVYFELTADIFLNTEKEYNAWSKTSAPSSKAIVWEPIGYSSDTSRDFAGVFDGNGYTVYGVYCSTTHEAGTGLFGSVRNGVVKNLNVKNAYITTTGKYAGGIAGIVLSNTATVIDNCSFSGDIVSTASVRAGGIAGRAYAHGATLTITNCRTEGTLTATGTSGGLIGEVMGVKDKELIIRNCYTAMNLDSTANSVAGLIGYNGNSNAFKVNISNSHVAGTSGTAYPLLGETLRTKSAPVTLNNVYYKSGSYTGTAKNVATQSKITATKVEEKTAEEFSNGTVTALLNVGIDKTTDTYEWTQGDNYPVLVEIDNSGNPPVLGSSSLTDLRISNGNLQFNSEIFIYDITVENEISSISLTPVQASNGTVIKVNGIEIASGTSTALYDLEVGVPYEFIIEVTEVNAQPATYYVNVTRKAPPAGYLNFSDDFTNATGSASNPLGNGWLYANPSALTVADGKVALIGEANREQALTRVVRPWSEARINQKIAVEFDAADFDAFGATKGAGNDRPRVLLRLQNTNPEIGDAVAYYADIQWNDKISIGRLEGGVATELFNSNADEGYIPAKPISGSYRLDFFAEGTNPTVLTVKYFDTSTGNDILVKSFSIEDSTAALQKAGSAGFHIAGTAKRAVVYTGVNYVGTDIGNTVPADPVSVLTNLKVSAGSIDFDSKIYAYNIFLDYNVSSIKFTPTADTNDTVIKINGVSVVSGSTSKAFDIKAGTRETFKIEVTKPFAKTVTYTVKVTRNTSDAWNGEAAKGFAGGSGTFADPYLISNAAELKYLADMVNNADSNAPVYKVSSSTSLIYRNTYFRLTNDIVLNICDEDYADWVDFAPKNNWTPIGAKNARSFGGNFNGAGYTIYGLYCNTGSAHNEGTGLFGRVFNGTIEHVTVKNACVIGNQRVGGIAGSTVASSIATINNCGFVGVIKSGSQRVGGITGQAQSQDGTATVNINNCWSKGILTANTACGGIAGYVIGTDGTLLNVNNCYSAMYITSNTSRAGGLLGHLTASGETANYTMTIRRCHFAGYINRPTPIVGDKDPQTPPQDPNCSENVYYMTGSYKGEVVNKYGAVEKTAEEFADGTVTTLFKNGAANPITDMWNWIQGEDYPVHQVSNDPVNFLPTLDDSLFNGGDWAANLENRDGGNRVVIEIQGSDAFEDVYENDDSEEDEEIVEDTDTEDNKTDKKPTKSDEDQIEEGKNNVLIIILSILGVILIAGGILFFIILKKRKKN